MQTIENYNKNHFDAPCKRIQNYIYKYSDVLGKGNFSTVYKAVNTITNETVAVKVIELSSLKSTKLKELLTYQIEILQKIDHPNIVKCFQVLTSINNCYIFTQLCQGGDLETTLKKKGQFLQSQTYELVKDLFQGLYYLSEKNIIHRDLKVSNIFLKNGRARIADFGFAKQSKQKFDDVSIGSPLYMSPQGFLKHKYGPKTDVWSFGIILYEITHGFTPYSHCKNEKQLSMMLSKQLKPTDMKSTLSEDFKDLLLKCLDVNEETRITFKQIRQLPMMHKIYEKTQRKIFKTQTTIEFSSTVDERRKIVQQQKSKDLDIKQQPRISQLIRKRQVRQVSPHQTGIQLINKNKPNVREDSNSKIQYQFVTVNANYGKDRDKTSKQKNSDWNSIRISNRLSPHKDDQQNVHKKNQEQKQKYRPKHDTQSKLGLNYQKTRQRISTDNDILSTKEKIMSNTFTKVPIRNSHMNRYEFATRDHSKGLSQSSQDNKYLKFNTSKSINKNENFDLKYSQNINMKPINEQKNQRKKLLISTNIIPVSTGTIGSSVNLALFSKNQNTNKNDENRDRTSNHLQKEQAFKQMQKQTYKQQDTISTNHSLLKPYLTEYCTKHKPQQNFQEQNRRQSMIVNQCFLNNLNLPSQLEFLQAVGLLHYCRLFYKFIIFVNDFKNDNNSQEPFRCSQRYPLWIMGLLGQIMDKIQSRSIIYERSKTSKEGKFKEVVKEYINKYTEYFLKYFPQNSKSRFNNKISSSDIATRLELDWKKLEQYMQKSQRKNSTHIVGGYYLVKILQWTRNIKISEKQGTFSRFKGNEIQNVINTKKTVINQDFYQITKDVLKDQAL